MQTESFSTLYRYDPVVKDNCSVNNGFRCLVPRQKCKMKQVCMAHAPYSTLQGFELMLETPNLSPGVSCSMVSVSPAVIPPAVF